MGLKTAPLGLHPQRALPTLSLQKHWPTHGQDSSTTSGKVNLFPQPSLASWIGKQVRLGGGVAISGSSAWGGQEEGWGHSGILPWHGSMAPTATPFLPPARGLGLSLLLASVQTLPSSAQANERKQVFQRGDLIYVQFMLHYTGIRLTLWFPDCKFYSC